MVGGDGGVGGLGGVMKFGQMGWVEVMKGGSSSSLSSLSREFSAASNSIAVLTGFMGGLSVRVSGMLIEINGVCVLRDHRKGGHRHHVEGRVIIIS